MELDKDLRSQQEARDLLKAAAKAQKQLAAMSQQQLDAIVKAISDAIDAAAPELARLAVEETGFGNEQDKIIKNRFAAKRVWEAVKDLTAVGVLKADPGEKLWEVGVPLGVIAAIVPSTNPTSTICYKALIALKSGNAIVFSPHPKAANCTRKAAMIAAEAARKAGAPEGSIGCLETVTLEGSKALMSGKETALILATGGPAMVRTAYSSGKPAIGVGAGNGPAYIHRSADVGQAMEDIAKSKTFDYGTICASEQSIIVEKDMEQRVMEEGKKRGFYFMDTQQANALAKLLFQPNGTLNPAIVGKSAQVLAQKAGFSVPGDVRVLVAREQEAGPTRPYSMEKLCPVLAFFVMDSEEAVLEKVIQVLTHEGSGHTFAMHCRDKDAVRRFALQVPVSRFLVNTPAALGGIGASTGLFPALTLGCGAVGGSSSSNNIGPLDLINIRTVAWDLGEKAEQEVDSDLVERIAQRILQQLEGAD